MSGRKLFVLCLSVLATVQLTNGQGEGWNRGGWDQGGWNQGGWNQRSRGHQSWGHNRQRADRAVCAKTIDEHGRKTVIEVTIKKSSSGWFGGGLELEIKALAEKHANRRKFDLVVTKSGADDNEGGCNVENLGNIVKRRNQGSWGSWDSWMGSSSSNGVIGEVDLTSGKFEDTFRNVPFSLVQEGFGCGIALCEDTEDVEDDSHDWSWGWGVFRERDMRCTEPILICCHLGKSEDDANSPDIH